MYVSNAIVLDGMFDYMLSAYDKKYGTEAEREARREAQAQARLKAMAERESLQRDEEKQLMEVIKASLVEVRAVVPSSVPPWLSPKCYVGVPWRGVPYRAECARSRLRAQALIDICPCVPHEYLKVCELERLSGIYIEKRLPI